MNPIFAAGSIAIPLGRIPTEFRNVKSFGARGDGVRDDTQAIQDALDDLPAAGGVVYLPAGTYMVSSTLTVPTSGAVLMGAGMIASVIKATTDITVIRVAADPVANNIRRVRITGLRTQGNNSDGVGHGIHVQDGIEVTIDNCYIGNHCDHGIYVEEVTGAGYTHNINIDKCTITGNHGWGIYTVAYRTSVADSRIQGNSTGGIYSQRAALSVVGTDVEGNGDSGVVGSAGINFDFGEDALFVAGCYFESNAPTNVLIGRQYTMRGVVISGNRLYTGVTTDRHIYAMGCVGLVIEGNMFYNAQVAAIELDAWNPAVNPKGVKNAVIQGNAFTGNVSDIVDNGVKVGTLVEQANDTALNV